LSETRAAYSRLLAETPVLAAPMCGISDGPYRAICRRVGARLAFTQMVSSEAIWRGDRKTLEILDLPGDPPGPDSDVGMQLFGGEPEPMAFAAEKLQELGAAVVDINMGCPAKKITCSSSGAALLRDLPRVARIFNAMRRVVRVPLTVKMRWDWGDGPDCRGAALEAVRIADAEGLDGVCLHARTREQGYSGTANWELIAQLREAAPDLPLVGNGDIRAPADALEMIRRSGCDAVMIGRAVIGDPWLLGAALRAVREGRAVSPALDRIPGGDPASVSDPLAGHAGNHAPAWPERREMMLLHARMMFESRGPHGLILFRKHAAAYLRGLPGAKQLRTRLMTVTSFDEWQAVLSPDALTLDARSGDLLDDISPDTMEDSCPAGTA
jgi:nifR3 family TIM-barrel protein